MTETLQELLDPQTVQQVFNLLIATYQANGFPTDSWQPFGTERTRLMAIATAITDLSDNYVPTIAAGGLLDYAEQITNPSWLRLLSENNFSTPYEPAQITIGNITVSVASGSGPYTISPGQLIAVFNASGNRYINNNGGTATSVSPIELSWNAEFAGAKYNDPSSATITLATSLAGVTLSNLANNYTDVAHVGPGTGTIAPTGSPIGPHQIVVQINSTGNAGTANWSYSLDGAPYVLVGTTTPYAIPGIGTIVSLVDGPALTTSFVEDDEYLFNTPGTWTTQAGSDDESSANLAQRCRDRWSTISPIPVNNFWDFLVRTTPSVGSQVTQVIVLTDAVINSKVNIIVAGPGGILPPSVIAAIQAYVNPRVLLTTQALVISPTTVPITLSATITASVSLLTPVQNEINVKMINYIDAVGINGVIERSKIIQLIMSTPGVIDVDVDSVTINGLASNKILGSSTTFEISDLILPLSFGYVGK